MTSPKKNPIAESLKRLEAIASWFEQQKEIDVEEGLERVKEGAELIRDLKAKLKDVENEFQEVKKSLSE